MKAKIRTAGVMDVVLLFSAEFNVGYFFYSVSPAKIIIAEELTSAARSPSFALLR